MDVDYLTEEVAAVKAEVQELKKELLKLLLKEEVAPATEDVEMASAGQK